MIIAVCTDDDKVFELAKEDSQRQPQIYGKASLVFGRSIPPLGPAENLFIVAHGAYKGDDNNPVVGDKENAFFMTAPELLVNLRDIFPTGYSGRVYVSACESADHGAADFSFAEVFRAQLQAFRPQAGPVFGRKGGVGYSIPPPSDPGWIRA